MKRNIKLTLAFVGTAYCGWQSQLNGKSVQSVLADAVFSLTGEKPTLQGCGRTDAKVHANNYICNFRTDSKLATRDMLRALNAILPSDICVKDACEVPLSFHSRFDAVEKQYVYLICNSPVRNPFLEGRALMYPYPIDEKVLNSACRHFLGTHDFSAFCASKSSVKDKTRTISYADVSRDGDIVTFTVRGNGFLYNMVRIMVGTLLYIAMGKIAPQSLPDIIASGERHNAGATAKAYGLYLDRVRYDIKDEDK